MADEFYFQWQNRFLRETIYPRREVKLIDFLVYYKEIDLWKEYNGKDITGEIKAYHDQKKRAVEEAVQDYYRHRNYFMKGDVRADYEKDFSPVDQKALEKINKFHTVFNTYLQRISNPRNETYFVSQQVLYWQQVCKDYQKEVASKQRRVFIMKTQNHDKVPTEEAELAAMEKTAAPMLEAELKRLNKFVAVSSRIEKRKLQLAKQVEDAARKKQEAERKLNGVQQELERQESLRKKSSEDLARLQSPPDVEAVKSYFSNPNDSAHILASFPQASQDLIQRLSEFRKSLRDQLSYSKSIPSQLNVVRNTLYNVEQFRKGIEKEILKHSTDLRNMGDAWKHKAERTALRDNLRDVSLKALAKELAWLADYQSALEHASRSKDDTARLIETERKELAGINARLSQLRQEAQSLQAEIDSYDEILIVTEEVRLARYEPDPSIQVAPKDIVQLKLEEYKAGLMKLDHYELLKLVVERFRREPERYPKWLQYMVIHFSGMRYASAHGSWADPKSLLASLRIRELTRQLKEEDDDFIEATCLEKLETYEPTGVGSTGTVQGRSKPPHVSNPDLKDRFDEPIRRLKRAREIRSISHQRNALIDILTEETEAEIDALEPAKVYEDLSTFKNDFPEGVWKEIVRLTELRVNQVTDKDWEKPATSSQPQPSTSEDAQFRQMLNDWKNKFVTGWREEHDRSDRLIVSRAVCNEVAEHIQHLRGHTPDGGLTAKPKWYQKLEKARPQEAYLVKPEKLEEADAFKPGASILWLRFVRKKPNEWQVAEHITTVRDKRGVLPIKFQNEVSKDAGGKKNIGGKKDSTGPTPWMYNRGGPFSRTRRVVGQDGASVKEEEWLRWMHEATVAEVADTAEGKVVLTFETALPTDDPSRSAIGVFKHYLSNLLSDRGEDNYYPAFVGYVPEGNVPTENLREMLDWDKILHRYVEPEE